MKFDQSEIQARVEAFHESANADDHFYLGKYVEGLKFHGTGDEGVELFLSVCDAAYQMYGIGDTWKAVLLASWAGELAKESEEYADPEDPNDFEMGRWG